MNSTVSVWVPLAVAGVGLASTFGAVILTRWADHWDRREQWRHEDAVRWYQERQQAYVRLMAALDEWDRELNSVASNLQVDAQLNVRTEVDLDELTRLGTAASQASALVQLMAPKAIRSLAQAAIKDRQDFRTHSLVPRVLDLANRPADFTDLNERPGKLYKRKSSLRDAMRDDLGIESKEG
jgi:hypothetical protein